MKSKQKHFSLDLDEKKNQIKVKIVNVKKHLEVSMQFNLTNHIISTECKETKLHLNLAKVINKIYVHCGLWWRRRQCSNRLHTGFSMFNMTAGCNGIFFWFATVVIARLYSVSEQLPAFSNHICHHHFHSFAPITGNLLNHWPLLSVSRNVVILGHCSSPILLSVVSIHQFSVLYRFLLQLGC